MIVSAEELDKIGDNVIGRHSSFIIPDYYFQSNSLVVSQLFRAGCKVLREWVAQLLGNM